MTVEIDTSTWLVACIVAPGLVPIISAHSFTRSVVMLVLSLILTFLWYQLALQIFQIYIDCTFDPKVYPALTDPAQTVGIFTAERRNLGVSTSPLMKAKSPKANASFNMPPMELPPPMDLPAAVSINENVNFATEQTENARISNEIEKPKYKQMDSYGQINNKELSEQLINASPDPVLRPFINVETTELIREKTTMSRKSIIHPFMNAATIDESNFLIPEHEVSIKALFRTRAYTIDDLKVPWWHKFFNDSDEIPDMHELAFPLRKAGPAYIKWFLQLLMFFQAIYMSGIVVCVLTCGMKWTFLQWILCAACFVGPYFTLNYTLPQAISRFAIITSIEHMKDQHLIHRMVQDAKKERLNNIVQLLQLVKLKGRVEQYQGGCLSDEEFYQRLKEFERIPQSRQIEIINVFDEFDTTNDGTISRDEMEDVLTVLGFDGESAAAESAMLKKILEVEASKAKFCVDLIDFGHVFVKIKVANAVC